MAVMRWGRRAFLIELLLSMVGLGICAAICLAGFAQADQISRGSRDLSHAVIRAQTVAEAFRADPISFSKSQIVQQKLDVKQTASYGVTQYYYDKNWQPVSSADLMRYQLIVSCVDDNAGMYTAQIDVFSGDFADYSTNQSDHLLYSLTVQKYLPENAKEVHR